MTRKVNTVNRGRASHYVNGAQPLKMGFSRDLARLKFNRTYVCKPDEVKRLKAELAAEKAKAKGKVVDNTELTNERKDDFDGIFTATTGASTEAQAGLRDSLAKQLKVKTQALIANETELDNERNAAFEGNVGDTGRESLAKQLADERDFTQQTPINNSTPFVDNGEYTFDKVDITHDSVKFKAMFVCSTSAADALGDWSNGEEFSYKVDFISQPNGAGDFWFISAPTNTDIKKIIGIKMTLDMGAGKNQATLSTGDKAVSYWGSANPFQHDLPVADLVKILEAPKTETVTDNVGNDVGNGTNWQNTTELDNFLTNGYNIIIYDYTTFKK